MGLSGCFRSPCIPQGISVESGVLETSGLDSRLGLIMGDFFLVMVFATGPESRRPPFS